jgi:hypothetical protein
MGPEKADFVSPTLPRPTPPPLTLAWSLPIGLAQSLPHSILIGLFLQTSLPATLYNPSDSQHRHLALKMVTVHFSETLASTNQSTWCLNPEEHHHYKHPVHFNKGRAYKSETEC